MVMIVEAFDRTHDPSPAISATWRHPFAQWTDDPWGSPPALVARLRPTPGTDDALRVATVSAVHRVLDHAAVPHVLPIRHVERDGEGRLVLRYRRVVATDLGSALREGPLPQADAFAILRQVCRALAMAHVVGIDHRVLGPASVLLESQGDAPPKVWLADFGIAQLFEADDDTGSLELHPTTPERVFGGASETSEDVYLVGCLAFWLFTGAPPFAAPDLATLQRRHAIEDPKRLSELALDGVPLGLDEIVARALDKEPEERWADVEELDAEIGRIQASHGVVTPWDQHAKPRRPTPVAAAAHDRERRGETAILRATAVLPTVTAPSPVPTPEPAKRRRPWILTAIGFSVGLVGLGFVDAPPPHEDVNRLAAPRRASIDPVPAVTGAPKVDPVQMSPASTSPAIAAESSDDAPALPPIPGPVAAATVAIEPQAAAPVRVMDTEPPVQAPRAQTERKREAKCELVRRAAADARAVHDWAGLLNHTEVRGCWPSEPTRVRYRVKALMELGRFAACVDAAREPHDDPELARWISLCRKRMEATG